MIIKAFQSKSTHLVQETIGLKMQPAALVLKRSELHAFAFFAGQSAKTTETAADTLLQVGQTIAQHAAARSTLDAREQILQQETLSSGLWLIGVGRFLVLLCNEIHVLNCFVVTLIELL